ncbi:MAG: N-acetylmuramoyl-L-alanine amidase [Parcubacteria group bacterium]|nr:N-acetylmuramoyl-L-alanine amidase [Parcubacteria group bacterium]
MIELTPNLVRLAFPATAIGFRWDTILNPALEHYRARIREGTTWQPWFPIAYDIDDVPLGNDDGVATSQLVFGKKITEVELTGPSASQGTIDIIAIDSRDRSTLRSLIASLGASLRNALTLRAQNNAPAITARSQWAADESLRFRPKPVLYPSGTVVKSTSGQIFLIDGSVKRWFLNAGALDAMGYTTSHIQPISESNVQLYASGEPITAQLLKHPAGTLISLSTTGELYLIENVSGTLVRRPITDEPILAANGLTRDRLVTITTPELTSYPEGSPLTAPTTNDRLVAEEGDGAIYLLKNSVRQPFASDAVREFLYPGRTPEILSVSEMTSYPLTSERVELWPASYAPLQKVIIHHTATTSPIDSAARAREVVRAIYMFHAVTRGWGDIGYNYLIDPFGTIYEGRYGGDRVVGAHTYNDKERIGYNTGTIGIALLGNFENTLPTPEALKALSDLIGYKLGTLAPKVDPTATSSFRAVGGYQSPILPNVFAHKDVDATLCPGQNLYSDLDTIRAQAKLTFDQFAPFADPNANARVGNGESRGEFTADTEGVASSPTPIPQPQGLPSGRYPDGTLIKLAKSPDIYQIAGTGKRHVYSMEIAELRKLPLEQTITVSDDVFINHTTGQILGYPEGTLVLGVDGTIYAISDTTKRPIESMAAFFGFGFKESQLVKGDQLLLAQLPTGVPLTTLTNHPNGVLLKPSNAPEVYLLENGMLRVIPNPEIFLAHFAWNQIVTISDTRLATYPRGVDLTLPDGLLIKGQGTATLYVVQNGALRPIPSIERFLELGYPSKSLRVFPDRIISLHPIGVPL